MGRPSLYSTLEARPVKCRRALDLGLCKASGSMLFAPVDRPIHRLKLGMARSRASEGKHSGAAKSWSIENAVAVGAGSPAALAIDGPGRP